MHHSEMNGRGDPDWEKSSLQNVSKYCEDPHVSCWCGNRVFGPQLTSLSCKYFHDNKMSLSKSVVEYCAFRVVPTQAEDQAHRLHFPLNLKVIAQSPKDKVLAGP